MRLPDILAFGKCKVLFFWGEKSTIIAVHQDLFAMQLMSKMLEQLLYVALLYQILEFQILENLLYVALLNKFNSLPCLLL